MNILITNHHLNLFGGSETFTFTLAVALKNKGHNVEILTAESGAVAAKLTPLGIPVHQEPSSVNFTPDIIHAHHNTMALVARAAFPGVPMFFLSHGVVPGLESPPSINAGIAIFAGVSEEVQLNLKDKYNIKNPQICRNGVDLERHCPRGEINVTPEKILIISNHYSNEQLALVQGACEILGAQLNMIGLQTQSVWETEEIINQHDVIISLGRGCLEAMACARAVFIFDHFGGDGFITDENYQEIRKHNFSGRRYRIQYSAETLAEQLREYSREMGLVNRRIVEEHHNIKQQVNDYLVHYGSAAASDNYSSDPIPGRELLFYQNTWRERGQIMNQAVQLHQENSRLKEQLTGLKPKITALMQEMENLRNKN